MTVLSIRRAASALTMLLCLSGAPALHAACALDGVITVGVVPQQAASDLAQGWIPLLREVSAVSGCEFRFATAPTITEFEKRLARGEYAIAYMNPYHYVVFHQAAGYLAFAREKDRKLTVPSRRCRNSTARRSPFRRRRPSLPPSFRWPN